MVKINNTYGRYIFLAWILIFFVLYIVFNNMSWHTSLRYLFDNGFGVGSGGLSDENDLITFLTSLLQLSGALAYGIFWNDLFIGIIQDNEDKIWFTPIKRFRNNLTCCDKCCGKPGHRRSYIFALLWALVGTVMGVVVMEWNFVRSLNWSIGVMTTTGSQTPPNDFWPNVAMTIHVLVGVPLFAIALGNFINVLQDEFQGNKDTQYDTASLLKDDTASLIKDDTASLIKASRTTRLNF